MMTLRINMTDGKENKMTDNFPEAGAIAFTTIKTPEGFTWNVTFRDVDGEAIVKRITGFQVYCNKNEWKAVEPRSFGGQKKEVEYVQLNGTDMACPTCKVGKVKIIKSPKGIFYGCDQSKFNPATKAYEGCKFFTSDDPTKTKTNLTGHEWDDEFSTIH